MALAGKNALITGSTSGIGLSIAKVLASRGCHLMLNGIDSLEAGRTICQGLSSQHKVRVLYSNADVCQPQQIRQMISQAISELGSVDILVNNAGIQHTARVEDFSEEKWDSILAINLSAAFHATKAVLPSMRQHNFGRIVNIASVHGLVGSVNKVAYVAAKHGLVGMTKVVALETAETGITCNALCPGWVDTPLVRKQIEHKAATKEITLDQATAELLSEKQPSKKFVKPEALGALVAFLAEETGDAMTGEIITVDGGWTAH